MAQQEFKENMDKFNRLINELPNNNNEQLNTLIKRYIEQNIIIMNDVLTTSIENLERLEKAETSNDIICTQARFTNELSKRLSLSAQRFLNASLGHISDYNEWLKAHCDFATD